MDNFSFYFEILTYVSLAGLGLGIIVALIGLGVNAMITILKKI